jgi:hypothetical protein
MEQRIELMKILSDLETNGKEQAQGLMNSASDLIEGVDVVVRRHALHLLLIAGDLSHLSDLSSLQNSLLKKSHRGPGRS